MPLRTSSGLFSGAPPAGSLAAAAPTAAAMTATARHTGVHHRVGGEGGVAGSDGGEVRDHTPRLGATALGTLRRLIGRAHGTHQLEPLLAIGALVLVESHKSHPSVSKLLSYLLYPLRPDTGRGWRQGTTPKPFYPRGREAKSTLNLFANVVR